jgi:hypothetical protein
VTDHTRRRYWRSAGEEFGFDSFMTHEPNLEGLGEVIAAI